jgi:hypothetical protein
MVAGGSTSSAAPWRVPTNLVGQLVLRRDRDSKPGKRSGPECQLFLYWG